eukprot:TRINITY_DN16560_c0_g1_i1.p1 TRINITY_DN16560_c0_g1~~TRINITY_DN16560_c0_g1_i1.p1  ORF type:complete len:738 (+),score=109.96 TRINITY_DN16560_c0_g1_i1:57-2270(+)
MSDNSQFPEAIDDLATVNDTFFVHLRGFMENKHDLQKIWADEVPEEGKERVMGIEAFDVVPDGEGARTSVRGRPVESVGDVYESAELVKGFFHEAVEKVGVRCGVETKVPQELKARLRAEEKVANDYNDKPLPPASWLFDVLRCSLLPQTPMELLCVLDDLNSSPDFKLLRLKNRFNPPLPNGYRDLLILAKVQPEGTETVHICEIQIHLASLYSIKSNSHGHYRYFRDYFKGADSVAVEARLTALRDVYQSGSESLQDILKRTIAANDPDTMWSLSTVLLDLEEYRAVRSVLLALENVLGASEGKSSENYLRTVKELADLYTLHLPTYHHEAEEMYRKILAVRDDMDTEESLANLLDNLGRPDEAKILYEKLVDGNTKAYGANSRKTALTKYNLGHCYAKLGTYEEAKSMYKEAEEVFVSIGESNLVTKTMEGTAICLDYQEKYAQALPIFRKVVDHQERFSGKESIHVSKALQNLGVCCTFLELFDEAEECLTRALGIKEHIFGEVHTSTAVGYQALGKLYTSSGKAREAIEVFQRCVDIRTELLGEMNMDVGTALFSLGGCQEQIGEVHEAIESYIKVVKIREADQTGIQDLCHSYQRLAVAYSKVGDTASSIRYFTLSLGHTKDPIQLSQSYHNLGLLNLQVGAPDDARDAFTQALALRRTCCPDGAPQILHTVEQLALLADSTGDYKEALCLGDEVVSILEEALGSEHELTVSKKEWRDTVKAKIASEEVSM